MKRNKIEEQIIKVAKSYNMTIEIENHGLNQYDYIPDKLASDSGNKKLFERSNFSGTPDIKKFLNPKPFHRLIDLGCFLNLYRYPISTDTTKYYGVDISEEALKKLMLYVKRKKMKIGGLFVASVDKLPFPNKFFQHATCINVFEYYTMEYIKIALAEIYRVLDARGKLIVDIPDIMHSSYPQMLKIEKYFCRPNLFNYPREIFEKELEEKFKIEGRNDSQIMIRYYLKKKNERNKS